MHPLGTGTRSCVLFIIFFAVLPAALFGQDLYFEKREFTALTIPTVADITEDDRGYLWIATPGGLVRYHGIGAELINRQSHPDLPADDILSVEYINDRQQLWIGTVAGLVEYDLKSENMSFPSIRSAERKSVGFEMVDIADMGDGSVFAVSRSEVFRSVRNGMLESVAVESQRSEAMEFFQVAMGEDGTAWLAASDGLKRWNFEKEVFEHVLNTGQPRCMAFLDGEVWLGTALAQVIRFDPDRGVVHRYAALGDSASIIVSPDNQIWVGSASGGLSIINPKTHEIQTQEIDPEHPYKLSSRRIQTLMLGGSGHIWIGTADAGLLSVDLRKRNHLTYIQRSGPQSIPAGPIHVVFEDSLGYLWTGSYIGGLARIDPLFNDIRQYTHRAGDFFSISGDHISSMIEDSSGRIWIGTDQGPALYISEIDGFEPPGIMMEGWPDFQGRHVLTMAESPNGAIWMSLRSGDFYKLDPMERDFVRFRFTPASVPSVMEVDSFGSLWAGSRRNLRIFNVEGSLVKTWLPVGTDSGGIPDGGVSALLWDSRDRLWLGSPTGLAVLRNSEEGFQPLMILNRSIINVSDLLEDSEGNIWIAEGRKIHILDAEGLHITTMDGESGLTPSGPITELALGRSGIVYAAANGELWSFESFLAPVPVNTPQVHLTELRVFNEIRANGRTLAEDNLVTLNSNENMFSIGFEALDYRYQEEVRYEYRLEGFHEDWIESGNMDSVTYVKLPPGQYQFVVRSSAAQGLYHESEAVINIRVEPTFWRTPFAIAIYAAVLAVTITIIVKLREGNLLKNQVRQLEEARKKVLEANRKLEFLTMNDSLTGLLNRRGFDQAIDHALTTAHRNSLMITLYMMDVDKFKPYNDNYGHVQGDEVLRCMGKALRNVFERSTDIIARYGGEEFAVVFIGDNPGASVTLANDMILAVEQLGIIHEYSTASNLLTLSMGSATIRATSDVTVTGLVNQADQALYAAKTAGRNRVCYTGIIPELPETMKNNIPPLINHSGVQI